MAIAGPRLDRPSAIGDEGRPRTTSLWIASVVVLVVAGVATASAGLWQTLPTLGTFVGLTVAGVGLANRERFKLVFVGYLLFMLFGTMLTGLLLLVLVLGEYGLAVVGLAIALLGIGLSWANVSASEGLSDVLRGTGVAYVSLVLSLVVLCIALILLYAGIEAVLQTAAGTSPVGGLVVVILAVGYAAGAVRLALPRLPIEQLVPQHRRPSVATRLRAARRYALLTAVLSPIALFAVAVAVLLGAFDLLFSIAPPTAAVLSTLATPPVLGTLATVGTLALLATVAAGVLRSATRQFDGSTLKTVAAAAAGVCIAVLLVITIASVIVMPRMDSLMAAVGVTTSLLLLPIVLVLVAGVLLLGVWVGLVPDRSGAPATAAAGLVLSAVGFGLGQESLALAIAVFACVAGAAIVWDCSWFGLGLTAELGHVPETRRLELFHGVVIVGVGALAVAALAGLHLLRTSGAVAVSDPVALLVAGVGVVLLLLPLRG